MDLLLGLGVAKVIQRVTPKCRRMLRFFASAFRFCSLLDRSMCTANHIGTFNVAAEYRWGKVLRVYESVLTKLSLVEAATRRDTY